jgi:PAS domain S-box-containing protein
MSKRTYWLQLLTVAAGLLWTSVSDHLLTAYYLHEGKAISGALRVFNGMWWILLTVVLVFRQLWRQQAAMLTSETQYRQLFECHPSPMWIYHRENLRFMAVNDAALYQYGYTREEWLQLTIRDIRPETELPRLQEIINQDLSGFSDMGTWRHRRRNGQVFPVSVTSHIIEFQKQPGKLVMATDISELVRSRNALLTSREESQQRAQIIDKINNLVLIVGEDSRVQWVNKAFIQFTGYAMDDICGKRASEILTGPLTNPVTIERLRTLVGRKEFFSDELINYKKNGETYWSQLNISPIYDEQGVFKFFISVETVITEKKEREEHILTQHTLLQEIAWSNSHEIRRPVCSILALIQLLKEASDVGEQKKYISLLERAGEELDQIIQTTNEKISRLEVL